uniref:(California timema) hypothetical protein n=1 Tax=Timema californicum TaxID=61474 RepID=A0A7R9JE99_TIMCA|nr:unnamed protein product [Timema californicum]
MVRALCIFSTETTALWAILLLAILSQALSEERELLAELLKNLLSPRSDSSPNYPGVTAYQEPSSRDLDIGLGIGVKDNGEDNIYFPYSADQRQPSAQFSVQGTGPREGSFSGYTDSRQDSPLNTFSKVINFGPVPFAKERSYAPLLTQQNSGSVYPLSPNGIWKMFSPVPRPAQQLGPVMTLNGGSQAFPEVPVDRTRLTDRVLVDRLGLPVMTAREVGDRQVGSFRLRNDRGYQVSMSVPPAPLDQESGEGVLVMEMKATLYRPLG